MASSLALLRSTLRRQCAAGYPAVKFSGDRICGLSTAAVVTGADTANQLKLAYLDVISPSLIEEFSYKNIYQVPKVEKIVVNCAIEDARVEAARNDLALITGQKPIKPKTQMKAAFANYRSKEAKPLGIAVTLRGNVMYSFLDRLIHIGHHRIKDFQGERPSTFDGKGNYSICFREATVFPEIGQDMLSRTVGLDISIKTTANTDLEAYKLLGHMGMPFPEGLSPTTLVRKKKTSKSKAKSKAKTKPKSKKR